MARNNTTRPARGIALLLLLALPLPAFCEPPARIHKISFSGNRVSEETLRAVLPLKEGGVLTEKGLEEAYDALYGMKLFKSVAVSTVAAGAGLVDLAINARDGWFLFPMPFAASGPSGGSAGLMVFSRNIFKRAETASVFGSAGGAGGSAGAFLERNGRVFSVRHSERSVDERLFGDGGFSTAQNVRTADGKGGFARYGEVAALYNRRQNINSISVSFPLPRRGGGAALSGAVSYTAEKNGYGGGQRELRGGGRVSRVSLGLNAGGQGEKRDDFGVIFGMGLADMEKRLGRSVKSVNRWRGGLTAQNAGAWTGSDFAFSKAVLSVENSTVWGGWNSLLLRCGAAVSANAPESQLPATGRETGLTGQYVREFRAPRMASFGAQYSKPLSVSRRGTFSGALFAETAFDPAAYADTVQDGAGLSFSYRFWRFPLPLGLAYTYSFRDRDLQLSAAMGGRF